MDLDNIKSPLPERPVAYIPPEEPTGLTPGGVEARQTIPTEEQSIPSAPIKKSKKGLFLIGGIGIVLLILILIVINLIRGVGKKNGQVTLIYWGLWEDPSVMAGVIADFEAKNPNIKITYKNNQNQNYRSRLQSRLLKTGQTSDEVPDIFRIHNTWIPMFRDVLAQVPTKTATTIGLDTDFYDVYKEDLKENGVYRAIPLMYDGLALFSNRDLLSAAQVSIPKNWWALEADAKKMTVKDENNKILTAGAALGVADNIDHWSDVLGVMMKQNGVNLLKNDEENNKKLQDVLTFYTQFRLKDEVWNETLPNSTAYFAAGKLAFYFGPSWRALNFHTMNPSLKFDVSPVPQLPTLITDTTTTNIDESNLTNIHWATYWVEGVNAKSEKQEAAWKFLEYLASQEGLQKMYAAQAQSRSFGEIYPRKSLSSQISNVAEVKPFVETANNASSWYLASNTNDDGVDDEMIKYFTDAVNKITQQQAQPASVIADLKNGVNQLIQKYQLKK